MTRYCGETETVTFNPSHTRGMCGRIGKGRVYIDERSTADVKPGDVWMCSIRRIDSNPNAKGGPMFAIPVVLIARRQEDVCKDGRVEVTLTGHDGLKSEAFNRERYTVHRSMNGRYLRIEPDENGGIRCSGNTLVLQDLDLIAGTEENRLLRNCTRNGDLITVDLAS